MAGGVKHLTAGEKQKIIELRQARVNGRSPSYSAIGRQVGRPRASVKRVLEDAGLATSRMRRLTIGEKKRIIELYRTRKDNRWMSLREVGKIVGRSPSFVHRVVTSAGVARNHGKAATMQLSAPLRQQIIRLSIEDGWSGAKIAKALNLKAPMACKVLRETDLTTVLANEAALLVALYQQGRSVTEVAKLTGRARNKIAGLVREAGVMRPRVESQRITMRRIAASNKLARLDVRPLAARWIDGAEVEVLAAEHGVPPDLMWDALAAVLSTMTPGAVSCIRTCPFACAEVCARTIDASTSKAGRLY
jgi:predicted transcriptional regulator